MTDSNDPLTNIQQALEAAEGKLKRIVEAFDHLDCGVFLYGADDRLVFCNARAREIYQGISDLLVPGMEYETLLREFYRRDLYLEREYSEDEWVAERIQRHRSTAPSEYEVQMRSGRWFLVADRKTADGGTIGFRFDITSRKETEFALAESEQRLRSLLNMSADWYWEQDTNYRFTRISSGMMRATGIAPEPQYGKARWEIPYLGIPAEQMEAHRQRVEAHQPFRNFEYAYALPGRDVVWVSVSGEPIFDAGRVFIGYRGVGTNITEKKQIESQVRELAEIDYLTGLPNRMLLGARFEFAVRQASRNNEGLALLFVDLDRFKVINDTLGHQVGDRILVESATRLLGATRSTDTVARLGGDEFVILLPGATAENDIANLADTLVHAMSQPHDIDGHELTITSSIGIALWPTDGGDLTALLKHADVAMLHAKSIGRNQYSFFRQEMNERVNEHLCIETALRRAIDRNELSLVYQPIFSIPDKQVIGAEALLRWHTEALGEISPTRFIAIAEDSGLIMPIGEWVIKEACAQLARWRAHGLANFPITVNVSGVQWKTPRLLDCLQAALVANDLTPADIELELTETALVGGRDGAQNLLERVGEAGFRLVIDDFGTGYSNLTRLKPFFVTKLKIDQSFIRDSTTDIDDAAIVRGIIGLARSLGLRVVAEGIEHPAQLDFLLAAGCSEAQGFLLAKPLSAAAFKERY
ncbi:MAG: EAL domain-containing protein [Rhodocyclaceae bacterium]|nr:EAL domain-containing protein [Rhodocyclaceae bacterium]MCA3082693.1 EAL domain-containing protein [Rhodocyclaceae bacterium]